MNDARQKALANVGSLEMRFPQQIAERLLANSPAAEARDLYKMVSRGLWTVAETRELIAVPPTVEDLLRAYALRYPEEGWEIEAILQFRQRVAEHFEILIADCSEWMFLPSMT